jgi:hypothetical protein
MKPRVVAVVLSVTVVAVVVLVRLVAAGPDDIRDLAQFQQATGIEAGPGYAFFAAGLNGDGAVFTIMAADPLGQEEGKAIHDQAYRYQRFGYAWAASAVALIQEEFLLAGLAIVGFVSLGLVAYIAFSRRETLGPRAWWLLANPALYVGVAFDTAEPLAILLLTVALMGGGVWPAVVMATVRPTYVLGLADRRRLFVPAVIVALAVRILWIVVFDASFLSGTVNLGLPLRGFLDEPSLIGALVMGAGIITLIMGVKHRRFSWVLSGLLVLCLSGVVYADPINAVRAAGMLPVLWAFGTAKSTSIGGADGKKSQAALLP